ncbi:DNA invertase Pin-like site-specific DNA recombinase [Desulfitobacterium sp. LBE]|uniref:recombinase family protein n=1 Tax=Desulfitobacterium sp. LBE TaxID=884086 RepID=UPI00119A49C8|nr:recombinase family protein [Desulfitobacterium sp. LBE]TWH59385.1 DNA invertase Pin-like site-specific DNA recombinase [Desulfitobacterium sp. LBE]
MNKLVVAMYIRLSDEDKDIAKSTIKSESDSIGNQRNLLASFISNHSELADGKVLEFCDDGYSGTNFERPSVQRLLAQVKRREIDCIVVKDFSRFGRNYLELGDYLEQVFPFLGVRFISVNDGYDSAKNHGITAGIDVGFRNLIYDMYSKDLSQKVKTAKTVKMKKGEYIGSFAPYGYLKSKEKKNSIEVDEEAALIVKRIFKLAADGDNTSTIAKLLNAEGIPSPGAYFKEKHKNKKWSKTKSTLVWQTMAILKILKDETYIGSTLNHKREKLDVNSKQTVAVSREQWIVVSNTHEAIVSEELFEKAQGAIRKIDKRKSYTIDTERVLYGQMKCGYCNKNLQRFPRKKPYYKCSRYLYDDQCLCYRGKINESDVLEVLLISIQQQAVLANKAEKLISKAATKSEKEIGTIVQEIRKAQQSIERFNALKVEEYEKYLDGKVSKDNYIQAKEKISFEMEKVTNQISKLETEYEIQNIKKQESDNQFVDHFKGKHKIKELSRELVAELVDSIYVFDENRIEIVWEFADDYKKIIELI